MTTSYSASDFLNAGYTRLNQIRDDLQRADKLRGEHDRAIGETRARHDEALNELIVGLIPALGVAELDRAVALTGAIGVQQADVLGWREAQRARLTARLAEIEADTRFTNRELLRAPRVGTLTRQIIELEDFSQPFVELVARAAHPRLSRLLETQYGTEQYAVPFWRLSYYGDWKAGDEILERFPGKTFAELRAELATATSTLEVYQTKLRELREEIAAGEALEREHAAATADLENLDAHTLERARDALRRHLNDADLPSLGERLRAAPELEAVAKRWAGLVHKVLYLERMREEQIDKPQRLLEQERDKLRADIAKYSRPKKQLERIPGDRFEKRFHQAPQRWQKHWQRYERGYDRVTHFHDYGRGSFASDFLWWDLMTDGQLDGNFIPEVNEWRSRHPEYHYDRDRDADTATAAAAIAETETNAPDASAGVDVS